MYCLASSCWLAGRSSRTARTDETKYGSTWGIISDRALAAHENSGTFGVHMAGVSSGYSNFNLRMVTLEPVEVLLSWAALVEVGTEYLSVVVA